jgi:hypothetical protein
MRIIVSVFAFLLALSSIAYAEAVVDFIVANNPELQELKAINKNIISLLKVEAKSSASYGQLVREGTSTLSRAQARYDVGISASIPLISPGEKAQRQIEEAQKERTLRIDIADLIMKYKAEQKAIAEETRILQGSYNEVQWIGKRVEVGVDNQKEYNQKLGDYLAKRKEHELRKEQVGYILEKILAYVPANKRVKLRGMLNEDLPKDTKNPR